MGKSKVPSKMVSKPSKNKKMPKKPMGTDEDMEAPKMSKKTPKKGYGPTNMKCGKK